MQGLSLESFDATDPPVPITAEAYQDGYAAGKADAAIALQEDQDRLTDALVSAVSEIEFTYVEAQADVLRSFMPLIHTIITKLLPHMSDLSFRSHVTQLIEDAATSCATSPLRLTVHPAQRHAADIVIARHQQNVDVLEDATLGESEAAIACHGQEQRVDLKALMTKIEDVLRTLEETEQRKTMDG